MTTPVPTQTPKAKLPAGLRWSDVWRTADGKLVQGEREVPVDKQWHIGARLFLCRQDGCTVEEWVANPTGGADVEVPCCPKHPVRLVEVAADGSDPDPVGNARDRLKARIAEVLEQRRQRAVDAAMAPWLAAKAAAEQAGRRTAADMRGHVPSLAASAGVLLAGEVAVASADPLLVAAIGVAVATVGAVIAYVAAYVAERLRARQRLVGRAARKARARARLVAAGVLAAGVWLCVAALLGVEPVLPNGAAVFLAGCLASWVVFRSHWDGLWETRRRLRELARQRAEEAARRAREEAERIITAPQPMQVDEDDSPEAMGRRMAAEWARIARSDTVPAGFLMKRTWIIPDETRRLTLPEGDTIVPIGWEYAIESEPGVLVARFGGSSPLLTARDWLASMLGLHPSLVSLVDRPDEQVNRALLSITDRLALGNTVNWKGAGSIRREGGAVLGHVGADMNGNDIFEFIEIPGQLTGGLTVGHSGGGKTSGARVSLLNDLAAGIFPVLYDPVKSLKDFSEFVGIFPMGCTEEHRDVILQSLHAERARRHKSVSGRVMRDRLGRTRPEPGVFQVGRDGPHIRSYWEEFHANSPNKVFLASYLFLMRVQRDVAMDSEVYTQGGGLQDLGDSVVRGLLNQVRVRLYRMPDNLARLAGYTGDYMPSQLPRVAGACLLIAEGVPPIPLRGAWVTRADEDGCVYDHLYGPDGTLQMPAPALPRETVDVWEREGLMDLWRLGQGPNGMANLIADTSESTAAKATSGPTGSAVGETQHADVILAIVAANPGIDSPTLHNHSMWMSPAGGGKDPVPATVSRAANKLMSEGLITRVKVGGMWTDYRVTTKGQAPARAAAMKLTAAPAAPTAADIEQQQELALELAEESA